MALNRREWMQRVSAGLVGVCLATKVPTAWLPETVQGSAACEFLRREVNAWFAKYGSDHPPKVIVADAALYDAFESEIVAVRRYCAGSRFGVEERGLPLFKGIPVRCSSISSHSGWRAVLVAGECTVQRGCNGPGTALAQEAV